LEPAVNLLTRVPDNNVAIHAAEGDAQLAAVLDPGLFVLGGGVSAAGEVLREPAWQALLQYLTARGHRPHAELRVAKLDPEAGIVGAGDLARDR
jgi:glucokinase